ncbi:MAG: hybrid sensor histidine kinase/response regulator [Halieaceae bacterium]
MTDSSNRHPPQEKLNKVSVEQVKTLYESVASLVMINLVVSSALVYTFWELVAHSLLIGWMAAMLLMLCARVMVYLAFKRRFDENKLKQYQAFLILGSASAGIIWGIGGLIMYVPGQLEYQLFIILSLLAMSAGSAFSLSIYLPAYFAFVPLMLAPIILRLLFIGDTIHIALASVTIIFLVAQTIFNLKINKSLTHAMSLRYENLELIEQLQEQKAEAERANRAKSSFLAAASHDLRQPLYALTLFTSALEERVSSPEDLRITRQITRSADSLQSLFDALLDISKLDAGTIDTQKSDFLLAGIIDKMAFEFDTQAAQHKLTIDWPIQSFAVHSNPILLEQILRNYVANALRYTPKGGIQVSCTPREDCIEICVSDTGIGIAIEDQRAIFDEFYQLGNPERDRQKGLGLGLSIVKRAAEQLGHRIDLKSEPGRGSEFSVSVSRALENISIANENSAESHTPSISTQPLILVIDDEESIREGLQELLGQWGCDVIAGGNTAEVILQLDAIQRQPHGIISDYRLQDGQTGLEAIDSIHKHCGDTIPALIVTGDTEQGLLITLKASGHQVLHKPVPPAKLRAFLRSLPNDRTG